MSKQVDPALALIGVGGIVRARIFRPVGNSYMPENVLFKEGCRPCEMGFENARARCLVCGTRGQNALARLVERTGDFRVSIDCACTCCGVAFV